MQTAEVDRPSYRVVFYAGNSDPEEWPLSGTSPLDDVQAWIALGRSLR